MAKAKRDIRRIYVYLLADELEYLRYYAKRKGQTMTEVMRDCIKRELRMDLRGHMTND